MSTQNSQQHTISLLVNNKPGVLIRIALVFSRRGYNIESVVVSPSNDPKFSRMSLVASGDKETLDQIIKQLNKLVDVIHATDHTGENTLERELALVKVNCPPETRGQILQIADHFKCRSVDISENTMTFEVTGSTDKLNAMHLMLDKYGILESIRTGKLVMMRGKTET
jgi:acetolactate synthase-1/3 small subunit